MNIKTIAFLLMAVLISGCDSTYGVSTYNGSGSEVNYQINYSDGSANNGSLKVDEYYTATYRYKDIVSIELKSKDKKVIIDKNQLLIYFSSNSKSKIFFIEPLLKISIFDKFEVKKMLK